MELRSQTPGASVTQAVRFVEHIPAQHHVGFSVKAYNRREPVAICLPCWLTVIATPPWWVRGFRGVQDGHLDGAGPLEPGFEVRRLRCEGCQRPMRVETQEFRRLPLRERCCCAHCQHRATLRRANERRRVRHREIACEACGTMFVPTQHGEDLQQPLPPEAASRAPQGDRRSRPASFAAARA